MFIKLCTQCLIKFVYLKMYLFKDAILISFVLCFEGFSSGLGTKSAFVSVAISFDALNSRYIFAASLSMVLSWFVNKQNDSKEYFMKFVFFICRITSQVTAECCVQVEHPRPILKPANSAPSSGLVCL